MHGFGTSPGSLMYDLDVYYMNGGCGKSGLPFWEPSAIPLHPDRSSDGGLKLQ